VVGMYWPDEYFYPLKGTLPEAVAWNPNMGGHAVCITSYYPDLQCAGASNSWTKEWNADAPHYLGHDFRPGDFGIPFSFFEAGKNSPLFELYAVSPEPVIVIDPPASVVIEGNSKLSSVKNLILEPPVRGLPEHQRLHRKRVRATFEILS
jgi:hypothetical protein